jgi:Tfp pilus assembly protein PilN
LTHFSYGRSRFDPLADLRTRFASVHWFALSNLVIAGSLLIVTAIWLVERERLRAVDGELTFVQEQLEVATAADNRVVRIAAAVSRLRETEDMIAGWQRETLDAANAIAALGNGLPPLTWLTAVQANANGTLSISGRSSHLESVGQTLRNLQRLDRASHTQLISIASDRRRRTVSFVLSWQRGP